MRSSVDLNSDIGEIADGLDHGIIPLVSSVNICCGVHAGGRELTRRTIALAQSSGASIGAHPGMLGEFGRTSGRIKPEDAYGAILDQLSWFLAAADDFGAAVHHVKPHGALYNQAEESDEMARAIIRAVQEVDPELTVYGLAGGCLVRTASELGLATVSEFFADRAYQADGLLRSRAAPDALVHDQAVIGARVLLAVEQGVVESVDGVALQLHCESVCVHGDTPYALALVRSIVDALRGAGISIRAVH